MIKKHKCEFILSSDLFEGLEDLWEDFQETIDVTFGDANRTLIPLSRVCYNMYGIFKDDDESGEPENYEFKEQMFEFKKRIENLSPDLYVDLEN